jgi:hypothetical protein
MATSKLRGLLEAGVPYDEIAIINEQETGWKPDKSTVSYKAQAMGFEPRYASHRGTGLLPRRVRRQHNNSEIRHMLQAVGRIRRGKPSTYDYSLASTFSEIVANPGKPLVVVYYPDTPEGFMFALRGESDVDVFRPQPERQHKGSTGYLRDCAESSAADEQQPEPEPERGCG